MNYFLPQFLNVNNFIVRKLFPYDFNSKMHEIGKSQFYFGFKEFGGPSLLDETYFSTKVYQYKEYSDQQGQLATRNNVTKLTLTYWGDRFRPVLPSPAFENIQSAKFYWTSSTDYTVGGNLLIKFNQIKKYEF